jgi:hypothetical protein
LPKIKVGGVYEIKLLDKYYAYVCEIDEYEFGLFDFVSENSVGIETLKKIQFRFYKSCKRTGITKKTWKKIGAIDLIENDIKYPSLIIYQEWCSEFSIKESKAMHQGNLIKIDTEEYMKLLKKGYFYGFHHNYIMFEDDIINNLVNNGLIEVDEKDREAWYKKRMEEAYPEK